MESGWLVTRGSELALWSGDEICALRGVPEIRPDRSEFVRFVAGKEFLLVIQTTEGARCFWSPDTIDWIPMGGLLDSDLKQDFFNLHVTTRSITWLKEGKLVLLELGGQREVELPDAEVVAVSPTDSGELIAVGHSRAATSSMTGWRASAWVCATNSNQWRQYPIALGGIQKLITKHFFPIEKFSSVDACSFPRFFLGDSETLDCGDRDTLVVELEAGKFRVVRTGIREVYECGRDSCGQPYFTTCMGEYIVWNGRRFKRLGWQKSISRFLMKSEVSSGITCVKAWDGLVRGMHKTLEASGTGDVIAFGSDNWGDTWFRCGDHGTPSDGWSVIHPFVRAT